MAPQRAELLVLLRMVILVALTGYVMTACDDLTLQDKIDAHIIVVEDIGLSPVPPTHGVRFFLEVVNHTAVRIAVGVDLVGGEFEVSDTDPEYGWWGIRSFLESGERAVHELAVRGEDPLVADQREDNILLRDLRRVDITNLMASDHKIYYYEYLDSGCGGDLLCEAGDDTRYLHERSDGTWVSLFVESPDRPFYLERDREDGDLGRLVVTFAPVPGSEDALE